MSHLGRRSARRLPRLAVAVAALLAHLVATFGWPFPLIAAGKPLDARGAYPCSDHPCGCASYDECWAGDCCCFTLAEKVAWAETRGVEVPAHVSRGPVTPKAPACCAAERGACCAAEKTAPAAKRVVGLFAMKCRGLKPGAGHLDPARPLLDDGAVLDTLPATGRPFVRVILFHSITSPPPSPPPDRA